MLFIPSHKLFLVCNLLVQNHWATKQIVNYCCKLFDHDGQLSSVLLCICIFLVNSVLSHLNVHTPEAGIRQLAETIGNLPRGLV